MNLAVAISFSAKKPTSFGIWGALRKAILPDGAEMMNEDSFEENGQLRRQSWMRRKPCRF